MKHTKILTILAALLFSANSQAGVVTFNSQNNHYYELISFTELGERLAWDEANAYAQSLVHAGLQGHLATITSVEEDDFVWGLGAQGHYLGGFDNSVQDQQGGWQHQSWQWVTGESFNYDNWLPGEPNHWQDGDNSTPNNEDYLLYWWHEGAQGGRWNDTNIDSSYFNGSYIDYTAAGFVVEYSVAAVPVPGAIWLFATALLAMIPRKAVKQ